MIRSGQHCPTLASCGFNITKTDILLVSETEFHLPDLLSRPIWCVCVCVCVCVREILHIETEIIFRSVYWLLCTPWPLKSAPHKLSVNTYTSIWNMTATTVNE